MTRATFGVSGPAGLERSGRNLYLFGPVGFPSVGPRCTGINPLPIGSDTVVRGVCAGLLADQAGQILQELVRMSTSAEARGTA